MRPISLTIDGEKFWLYPSEYTRIANDLDLAITAGHGTIAFTDADRHNREIHVGTGHLITVNHQD